jgi:Spy/CpxP family protein refolding chaperone
MKPAKSLIAAALMAASLVTVPALARPHGGPGGCDGGHPGMSFGDRAEHMARRLDLTKEQRDSVRAVEDKYRPQMRALRDRMMDTRKALADAAPGDARLRELADAQGKTMAEMIVLRAQIRAEMDKILTDAQREQMRQWRERPMRGRG